MEDIDEQIEWLSSIKINQLSNRALTLASKLARSIRAKNGNTIKLQDEKIAVRLAEQVTSIDSPDLHRLYRDFLEEAIRVNDSALPDSKSKPEPSKGYYRGVKIK